MQGFRRSILLGTVLTLMVSGCGQDDIQEQTTPKSDFSSKPAPPASAGHAGHGQAVEVPEWDLPHGWSVHPGSGIRYATLHVDSSTPPTELRVTPLAPAAGDPLSNVNRWASQIGLPDFAASQLGSVMREIEIHGRTVQLVKLTGPAADDGTPAQQILASIVMGEQSVWFFMIMGEQAKVRPLESGFESFMKTVRLTAGAPSAPPAAAATPPPAHGQPASGDEQMTWQLPPHWQLQSGSSNMRVATINVTEGGDTAEVSITKFPGDVGGMLQNINRWRRQLGMPAVASLQDQPLQEVVVATTASQFLDLNADPTSESSQRMYVVTVPRRDMTWFIKMTGTADFVNKQKASYDAFIASVDFTGGTPGE